METITNFDPYALKIDEPVRASPVGSGTITGITQAGYPQVNHIAVAWCIRSDGLAFDPYGHTRKPGFSEDQYQGKSVGLTKREPVKPKPSELKSSVDGGEALTFARFAVANVNNPRLSDHDFREVMRNSLKDMVNKENG